MTREEKIQYIADCDGKTFKEVDRMLSRLQDDRLDKLYENVVIQQENRIDDLVNY